jgi:prepilin-type N-terminal cleavage/methylation domain-containing protein
MIGTIMLTTKMKLINKSKGFTLIELIVVMAIFLFIIGAAISIFISMVQQQKKVLAEQQLLSQISYVEEYMSKAFRVAKTETTEGCLLDTHGANTNYPGYIYLLTRYDSTMGQFRGIKFINQDNGYCQEFFLSGSGTSADPYILKELKGANGVSDNNDNDAVALTATNLQISSVKFSINGSNGSTFTEQSQKNTCTTSQCGASNTDTIQPRVTMLLSVSIPGESARTFQTTISQRNLNVQQ